MKKNKETADIDWLVAGIILFLAILFSVSSCLAQPPTQKTFDSLKVENLKLRNTIKTIPTTEVLNLFDLYQNLLANCESTKNKIVTASKEALTQTTIKLTEVEGELSIIKQENALLKEDLHTANQNIQSSIKLQKKARRKVFFERAATIILSSSATILMINTLR